MELTMPRPGKVFDRYERPVCSKCGKPSHFGLRGQLVVCDASSGNSRCGTWHYAFGDDRGNVVLLRVTKEEAAMVRDADLLTPTLQSLGLPQMAQQMLSGMRKAA